MISDTCRTLRSFCLEHEWVRNGFAFFGAALFVTTIWVSIEYQLQILDWIRQNTLVNLAILGGVSAVNHTLMFGSLCLGFSDCSEADKNCMHAYRGRGKGGPLYPEMIGFVDSLGKNPKHRPGGSRSVGLSQAPSKAGSAATAASGE